MRQLEDDQNNLREQLEEEEEAKRNMEKQLIAAQAQVQTNTYKNTYVCGRSVFFYLFFYQAPSSKHHTLTNAAHTNINIISRPDTERRSRHLETVFK